MTTKKEFAQLTSILCKMTKINILMSTSPISWPKLTVLHLKGIFGISDRSSSMKQLCLLNNYESEDSNSKKRISGSLSNTK